MFTRGGDPYKKLGVGSHRPEKRKRFSRFDGVRNFDGVRDRWFVDHMEGITLSWNYDRLKETKNKS